MQAYCVKCRCKVDVKSPANITFKNGKPATQGVCPVCGTRIFRIGAAPPSHDGLGEVIKKIAKPEVDRAVLYKAGPPPHDSHDLGTIRKKR